MKRKYKQQVGNNIYLGVVPLHTLMDHMQDMLVYTDPYNLMDTFLHGLLESMLAEMLKNGLTPEANTVDDFIVEGKSIEEAIKTQEHYKWQVVVPIT